jgi:acylphosphatase
MNCSRINTTLSLHQYWHRPLATFQIAHISIMSTCLAWKREKFTSRMQPGSCSTARYNFKVTGLVQGVFFRKYTKERAEHLDITGWCRNTADGKSVEGEIEGSEENIRDMMQWLHNDGSPHSSIENSVFEQLDVGNVRTYDSFYIRK